MEVKGVTLTTSPALFRSAGRSLIIGRKATVSSAPEPAKPLTANRDGNNPLIEDQSRFTIRLENTPAPFERNHRDAVDHSCLDDLPCPDDMQMTPAES
jgi:hypothetical protein